MTKPSIPSKVWKQSFRERRMRELTMRKSFPGGEGDVKYEKALERQLKKLEETWKVNGQEMSINQVWEWICQTTAQGESLVNICCTPGSPSLRTIVAWRKQYPEFDALLKEAEEVRGIILVEQHLNEAMKATDAKNAPAYKLRSETLRWMGQKNNSKFEDKMRGEIEHVHKWKDHSEDQLKSMLKAALLAAKGTLSDSGVVIDVEPEEAKEK